METDCDNPGKAPFDIDKIDNGRSIGDVPTGCQFMGERLESVISTSLQSIRRFLLGNDTSVISVGLVGDKNYAKDDDEVVPASPNLEQEQQQKPSDGMEKPQPSSSSVHKPFVSSIPRIRNKNPYEKKGKRVVVRDPNAGISRKILHNAHHNWSIFTCLPSSF